MDTKALSDRMFVKAASTHKNQKNNFRYNFDFFKYLTKFFAFIVFSFLIAILITLVHGSLPSIDKFGLISFFLTYGIQLLKNLGHWFLLLEP